MSKTESKVRVYKASKSLQIKAGIGDFTPDKLIKADRVIEENTIDFSEIADLFLLTLLEGIKKAKAGAGTPDELIAGLVRPVMSLKAHGKMFKFDLVSSLADIVLGFLEHIKELDADVIDIVEAHHKTLSLIIKKGIRGDGGGSGPLLKAELNDACRRYQIKNAHNFVSH
mgnify:CR=1 FL=1|jgi:hypothetical protein